MHTENTTLSEINQTHELQYHVVSLLGEEQIKSKIERTSKETETSCEHGGDPDMQAKRNTGEGNPERMKVCHARVPNTHKEDPDSRELIT